MEADIGPAGFFLMMDHSASMSDNPCVNLNVAVDAFLKAMQENNQKRVIRAAKGEYYDIDPRSVADFDDAGNYVLKDVATIKSVMGEHLQYLTGAVTYNNKVRVKVAPNERVAVYTDDERKHLIDLTYWENNGRYMGKLGTDWGLGHVSTERDYGSGVLLGIPDYAAESRVCRCNCSACRPGREYTSNCNAALVPIVGKPGYYKCSVHGLNGVPPQYQSGYPANGNCMVQITYYRDYCESDCAACRGGSCPDCKSSTACLDDMTRTDMATGQIYNWIFHGLDGQGSPEDYTTHRYNPDTNQYDGEKIYTPRIVLATDGAPAGYSAPNNNTTGTGFNRDGFDGGSGYDYVNGSGGGSYMFWNVSPLAANNALAKINAIKNLQPEWITSYVTYVNVESDPTAQTVLNQLDYEASKMDPPRTADLRDVWQRITQRKHKSLTSIFMMLYSSCAQNAQFVSTDNIVKNITNYTTNAAEGVFQGYSPKYFKFYNNSSDIPAMEEIIAADNTSSTAGASTNGGYANYESYLLDEITDPFEITSVSDIRVYAVPRIPANMNADGSVNDLVECYADGCPVSVDIDADNSANNPGCSNKNNGGKKHAYVTRDDAGNEKLNTVHIHKTSSFRWGEQFVDNNGTPETEWVDVTNEVEIITDGNQVKVTGYNYEANAVSDFDKDQFRRWPISGNGTKYKVGDYGYKLVVIIPINAKITFGGNGIRTNNTDISGFLSSLRLLKLFWVQDFRLCES